MQDKTINLLDCNTFAPLEAWPKDAIDLALVFLAEPVSFVPASTATNADLRELDQMRPEARFVQVVGFGRTESLARPSQVKRFASLPLVSVDCTRTGKQNGSGLKDPTIYPCQEGREMVISTPSDLPSGTCGGDSGGPIYFNLGAETLLAGVTSRPLDNARGCGYGSIGVLITAEISAWIETHVSDLPAPAPPRANILKAFSFAVGAFEITQANVANNIADCTPLSSANLPLTVAAFADERMVLDQATAISELRAARITQYLARLCGMTPTSLVVETLGTHHAGRASDQVLIAMR